jgi:hypothetical protein
MTKFVDIGVVIVSTALIGIGVAIKDPALSLVVVGGIGLAFVVLAQLKGKQQ